jgi:hypothetical protein
MLCFELRQPISGRTCEMSDILKSTATTLASKTRRSVITLEFLRDHPTALLSLEDLKQAKIIGSHQSAQRWVKAGKLAVPLRLPNGQLRWTAQDALDALDHAGNLERRSPGSRNAMTSARQPDGGTRAVSP